MSRKILFAVFLLLCVFLVNASSVAVSAEEELLLQALQLEEKENQQIMLEMNNFAEAISEHEELSASTDASLVDGDMSLLEVDAQESTSDDGEGEGEEKPEHPTYVLPYPPVLPGHYTPLFNPYTNVNPLSTPFANYAAQPGAHPGVAAAAAAQAAALASANGQIAGAAGGYPYFPYAARGGFIGGHLTGNPIPFSGYAGWIHPQNLNSAAVGDNEPEEFPQFVEIQEGTENIQDLSCVGCEYNA